MKRHVALIIETSSQYGRELLSGVIRYMRMHDDWSVFLEQRDLTAKPPEWLEAWTGDGIISRATTPSLVSAVSATGVPLVELTDRHLDLGLTHVWSDDEAIGRMATEHLIDRGFRHFGFCGFTNEAWSDRRGEAFADRVKDLDSESSHYQSQWLGRGTRSWDEEQEALIAWLKSLPKPCGIMACNDVRGQQVVDACSNAGLAVPEEVAVIGVDNDALLCRICDPPLSSVIPNAEGVGFRAAELLSAMMDGGQPEQLHTAIPPMGVAVRQSTDVVAIDDPQIANALHYIRENACRGISVDEVVKHSSVSRSTLERKLRQYLGRSPQQEIRSVQIKRVRELLATTDLTAERIARLCGFEHPEYMHAVFKREVGMTPGAFRDPDAARQQA